jgi:DNA-binding NtrC family response regulator
MPNESNNKRALIVEDEPVIGRVCQRILKLKGYDVDLAVNGRIATEMVKENSYDVCVSDIRTPEMSGMDFYRFLEKEYPALAGKLIFSTGDVLSGNVGEFLKKVNRPYLAKPFTPDELSAIVDTVVSGDVGIMKASMDKGEC